MSARAVFLKSLTEQRRDLMSLGLTLFTTPVLVLFFALAFGKAEMATVLVADGPAQHCSGGPSEGESPAAALVRVARASDALSRMHFSLAASVDDGRAALRKDARALIVIWKGPLGNGDPFCGLHTTTEALRPAPWVAAAALFAETAVRGPEGATTIRYLEGERMPSALDEGLPPLLAFSAIMLVFSTAMAVAREVEAGTLVRLRMTRLGPSGFLAGVAASQALVGIGTLLLSVATARALGLEVRGSTAGALLAVAAASLGCVGLGVVVASRAPTVHRAFLVASFAMLALMLFSGIVFPVPAVALGTAFGHRLELFELLPTSHAVAALRACTGGASLDAVAGRIAAASLESLALACLGIALFRRAWQGG